MLSAENLYEVVLILTFVSVLIVQLLLCFKVKSLVVRLIPCVGLFALTAFFFVMIFLSFGWDSVGYVILTLYSGIALIISGIGWGIWLIAHILKKRRGKSNPERLGNLKL